LKIYQNNILLLLFKNYFLRQHIKTILYKIKKNINKISKALFEHKNKHNLGVFEIIMQHFFQNSFFFLKSISELIFLYDFLF
jgi:hypothetical protein